jgi:pimeloyl-ACP methyl ester carboxylesterase
MSELGPSERVSDDALRVQGATLFYRIRGSGPLLLILPGCHGDANTADALCTQLIDRYTVVTYDRRGMSRSAIDVAGASTTIATHSDDVHRLLAVLTHDSVSLLGSSMGALIGLDLVARHPRQIGVLGAHEPPAWQLLSDVERDRAMRLQEDAEDAFRRGGPDAGFKKMVALEAVDYDDREPGAVLAPPTSERV